MAKKVGAARERGHIRKRGNSYQVLIYAGVDPLTGRELRLTESTTDEAEATRILKRFRAQVDEQSHARTKATFRTAMEAWLRVHEIEETTRQSYEGYAGRRSNPAAIAKKPRQPTPRPHPPTVDEASHIVTAAWEQDPSWGTLVWLVMVTGIRRAELLALRWADVDFAAGTLTISRNYVRVTGQSVEKDTKTHQMRRISLDPATVDVLAEHRQRYDEWARQLQIEPSDNAYLFSHEPMHDRPYDPSAVSHRYSKMCRRLGIDSHLHALRHYSATELLTAGVDLRTVAGRLGHGGGGATTLRVYAAWVGESDRRAAEILGTRVRRPPRPPA